MSIAVHPRPGKVVSIIKTNENDILNDQNQSSHGIKLSKNIISSVNNNKICKVCIRSKSEYCCPTCFIPYCSLNCYKKHNIDCLELFSKQRIKDQLDFEKSLESNDESFKQSEILDFEKSLECFNNFPDESFQSSDYESDDDIDDDIREYDKDNNDELLLIAKKLNENNFNFSTLSEKEKEIIMKEITSNANLANLNKLSQIHSLSKQHPWWKGGDLYFSCENLIESIPNRWKEESLQLLTHFHDISCIVSLSSPIQASQMNCIFGLLFSYILQKDFISEFSWDDISIGEFMKHTYALSGMNINHLFMNGIHDVIATIISNSRLCNLHCSKDIIKEILHDVKKILKIQGYCFLSIFHIWYISYLSLSNVIDINQKPLKSQLFESIIIFNKDFNKPIKKTNHIKEIELICRKLYFMTKVAVRIDDSNEMRQSMIVILDDYLLNHI